MDSMQRIYKLHQAISSRRHPVSCQTLQAELGCSRATVKRIISELRLYFNAPLEYDRWQCNIFSVKVRNDVHRDWEIKRS